jgi:high affinity Mn2+ porin
MTTQKTQFPCCLVLAFWMVAISGWATSALAQTADIPQNPDNGAARDSDQTADDPIATMFTHSQTARYWISGQDNIIFQWHPSFSAKYSGPHSFATGANNATSNVSTLFLGYQLRSTTEVFLHIEEASGGGLSDGLGLAGFTNLDVVRNPVLSKAPYVARVMIRQIIPLSTETVEAERGPWALATSLPARRLELRAGKFGMNDFFDTNAVGSDSHFQFMNWAVDDNGAYDYAADTRGYTYAVMAGYYDRNWSVRFGESLMPKVANGIDLVWNLRRARAENLELELHPKFGAHRGTTIRLLSFVNHANMGVYRDAVNNFLAGKTPVPEITAHPLQTTMKYGFGLNLEQDFAHHLRGYARWGWNEGQHESYAYTEVDETVQVGGDLAGYAWRRRLDKVGAVFVSNGICADHQHYLALGGLGFLLGDGALNYGRENIFESYYTAHIWRGIFAGPDLQHINNPGYNRDRGPVLVAGLRFHLEF